MMFITSECERMGIMNYKNFFDALNMTFRPAARCATYAGGNLRHLIGSSWAGGVSKPIAGRFLRRFRSRFEGRRFREVLPGALPGALPGNIRGRFRGGGEKESCFGLVFRRLRAAGRRRQVRHGPAALPIGRSGKDASPRDCHHTTAARAMRSFVVVRDVNRGGFGSRLGFQRSGIGFGGCDTFFGNGRLWSEEEETESRFKKTARFPGIGAGRLPRRHIKERRVM